PRAVARPIAQWNPARATPSGSYSLSERNPAADRVEARLHPDPARFPRRILQPIPWDPSVAGFVSPRRRGVRRSAGPAPADDAFSRDRSRPVPEWFKVEPFRRG